MLRIKADLVIEPFADGWCVRMSGASTPSYMSDDFGVTCDWATALAEQLHLHRVEVRDRCGRTTEVINAQV